jgi:hypothetical protein
MGTESQVCDDCKSETRQLDYCDGFCYDYKLEWLEESVDQFVEAIGNPYELRIEGRRMGWTGASGYAICKANSKDLLAKLTFSGDWRLRFVFDGNTLAITRWSHDEPTGASFEVVAEVEEEQE